MSLGLTIKDQCSLDFPLQFSLYLISQVRFDNIPCVSTFLPASFLTSPSCSLHTGPKASLDTPSSTSGNCAGGSGELARSWFVGIHWMNSVRIFADESCLLFPDPVPSGVIRWLGILILGESLWVHESAAKTPLLCRSRNH